MLFNKLIFRFFSRSVKPKEKSFYEIFDVSSSATQKEIKQQYLKKTKIYHPDVYKGQDTGRYTQILKAYEVLRNPVKRSKYDKELQSRAKASPKSTTQEKVIKDVDKEIFGNYPVEELDKKRLFRELEEFKKMKVTTDFGEINIRENSVERQMSKHEKLRQTYIEEFKKRKTRKSYSEKIKIKEMDFKDLAAEKLNLTKTAIQQEQEKTGHHRNKDLLRYAVKKKQNRLQKLSIIVFGCFGVFFIYTLYKKRYFYNIKQTAESELNNKTHEIMHGEIRQRFKYD